MQKILLGFVAAATLVVGGWAFAADPIAKEPFISSADCCCVVEKGELVCAITGEVLRECSCK